jgi:GT2 family glycosyltransferase
MKIAVVILNWNGKKLLAQFLPSVVQNSPEATIYVADNNSSDDSISYITTHFPSVQIIKNEYNFGFAQGYNVALKSVEADIFA